MAQYFSTKNPQIIYSEANVRRTKLDTRLYRRLFGVLMTFFDEVFRQVC